MDKIDEWLTNLFVSGIIANLTDMFDDLNNEIENITDNVAKTPSEWNPSIFDLIQNISETVILPIAGMILTFVMCNELISMIIDRNNMQDFPPSDIFKWLFKTCMAILLVTNVFDIVLAIFDVSQHIVRGASSVIISDTAIDIDDVILDLEFFISTKSPGDLILIWILSLISRLIIYFMNFLIMIVIYGRMIEIYLTTALAPIPFATLCNKEHSNIGQNYIKGIIAIGFQAFLIMICVGIYAVLLNEITTTGDPLGTITECIGYTILFSTLLFKTGSMAKAIFNAH